jgi:hypothetical protein
MARGERRGIAPAPVACSTGREPATPSACGLLRRASARRRPSSFHPGCRGRASTPDPAGPRWVPAGVAARVLSAQRPAGDDPPASRREQARASLPARVAVRPARGEPFAVAEPTAAAERASIVPAFAAAAGSPVPPERGPAARPAAAPLVGAAPAAVPRVVRAALPLRAAPAAAPWVPAGRPAAERSERAPSVRAAPSVPAERLAAERPKPAPRVAAAGAAARPAARAPLPCRAVPTFRVVPVVAPSAPALAASAMARCPAPVRPEHWVRQALPEPCALRICRVRHRP